VTFANGSKHGRGELASGETLDSRVPHSDVHARNFRALWGVTPSRMNQAETHMGSGQAGKGMGNQATTGRQHVAPSDERLPDESEMTQQAQGNNQRQGDDRLRAHNERRGVPGETTRTQGVVESFELQDPKKRAAAMKGRR
jgi:hypothetical protein